MVKNDRGSIDGMHVKQFLKDVTYNTEYVGDKKPTMSESLAKHFIKVKSAVISGSVEPEVKKAPEPENKKAKEPENKKDSKKPEVKEEVPKEKSESPDKPEVKKEDKKFWK